MKTFVSGRTFRKCYPFRTHSQVKELQKFLLQVKNKGFMKIDRKLKTIFVLRKTWFSPSDCFIYFVLGRLFIKEGPLLKVCSFVWLTIIKWSHRVQRTVIALAVNWEMRIRSLNTSRRVNWCGNLKKADHYLCTYYKTMKQRTVSH